MGATNRVITLRLSLPESHDWVQDPPPAELEVSGYGQTVFATPTPGETDLYYGEVEE